MPVMTPEERARDFWPEDQEAIADMIREVIAEEREACAKVAEAHVETALGSVDTGVIWRSASAKTIAAAIRSRENGETVRTRGKDALP